MSTFCTFETEYRLTRIDQSFRHLSLRCTWCNRRKCGFIWISWCGAAGSGAWEVARDIWAYDAIGGPWIHFSRFSPRSPPHNSSRWHPNRQALYSGCFARPGLSPDVSRSVFLVVCSELFDADCHSPDTYAHGSSKSIAPLTVPCRNRRLEWGEWAG